MRTRVHYELLKTPEWEAGFYYRPERQHRLYFLSPEPGTALYRLNGAASCWCAAHEAMEAFQEGLLVVVPRIAFDQPWAGEWSGGWRAGFFLFNDGRVYFLASTKGQAWWLDFTTGEWCASSNEGWTERFLAQAVPLARIVFEQEEIT